MTLPGQGLELAAGILAALLAARRGPRLGCWRRALRGPVGLVAVALASGLTAMASVDWQIDPPPVISDEASYRLQASLFAAGRWTDTTPTHADALRQMYVLDQPRVASKYPPGHALVLAPGFLIGFPWVMPLVCLIVSGALVFAIGRRLASAETGFIAWLAWLTCAAGLEWRGTWFSENTSSVLMLLGWWLLLDRRQRPGRLLALGGITGWLAITRPLTAVAFAMPVAIVLLGLAVRRRSWVPILLPVALGLVPLALVPLWNWRTLDRLDETPLERYSSEFMPWDRPGFGADSTAPLRVAPNDQAQVAEDFAELRGRHTVGALPGILADRFAAFGSGSWSGWRRWLIPVGLAGLLLLPAWLVGALVSQFLWYGWFYHPSSWSLYYLELVPVLSLAMAIGLAWLLRIATPGSRRLTHRWLCWVGVVLAPFVLVEAADAPGIASTRSWAVTALQRLTADLPAQSIVFVRYTEGHNPHAPLVANLAPYAGQRVLLARDQGTARNLEIARVLGRRPYRYAEHDNRLQRLTVGP